MRRSKLLFLFSCVILICALAIGCASTGSAAKADGAEALSLWNDEAPAKKALTEYMAAVTKEGSADFIPKEHRIAVFDLDGTLLCETHPTYFDIQMFIHRVTEDPTYTPTKAMIDYAENFKKTGVLPPINTENEQMFTETYKGMTLGEFAGYVESFMETDQPGYENLKRKDAFYKPMVELIHYLIQNDFTVYVSSGTNRLLLRTLTKDALGLPQNQIIGSADFREAAHRRLEIPRQLRVRPLAENLGQRIPQHLDSRFDDHRGDDRAEPGFQRDARQQIDPGGYQR